MKFDIPYSYNTTNIGDDVIVYSIYQQFEKMSLCKNIVDNPTSRESLFELKNSTKNIISGWLSFNVDNFLPENITENTLLYGIHFWNEQRCMPLIKSILDNNLEVGCRDSFTYRICKRYGIRSYISYCPTLLLDKINTDDEESDSYSVLVDIYDEDIISYVKEKTGFMLKWLTHRDYFNENRNFQERMINVKNHLNLYCKSKLVISNKMHVLLPCMSMGVPCLFYKHDTGLDTTRLQDYYPFLNTFENIEELKKFDLLNIKNKDFSQLIQNKSKLLEFITDTN